MAVTKLEAGVSRPTDRTVIDDGNLLHDLFFIRPYLVGNVGDGETQNVVHLLTSLLLMDQELDIQVLKRPLE